MPNTHNAIFLIGANNTHEEYANNEKNGGASTLKELIDVDISTPSDGDVLSYDDTNDEWINISLGSAALKDVAASGDASSSEVVLGNDSRLTNSRNAADVYSWAKAENKPTYTATEVGAIASTEKGANSGIAELDATGKVPSSQLPSYVDDVLEYDSASSFPSIGETGKIYVDKTTNKTYRWGGSEYVEISASLALGETLSTAYRGDRGKEAYDHSQITNGNPHNVSKSDVGLGNVGNFKALSTVANQGLSSTEQSNAQDNIGLGTVVNGLMLNTLTATLDDADWILSNNIYTQTKTVTGIGINDIIFVSIGTMSAANRDILLKCKVACTAQTTNSLTFEAAKLPTMDIPIVIVKQGVVV